MAVPARVSLVTLGVDDVERATAFYLRLGWEASRASVPGEVTFLRTAGSVLALYGAEALAADTGLPVGAGGPPRVSLALNVTSAEEVDGAVAEWAAAGGRVLRPAARAEWGGYVAHVADPDGHLWEIAHNPGFPLGEDGLPRLP